MSFSQEELIRYARHAALPGFGMDAQRRLKEASILVIGAGGLGAPLLYYLAAAGVGRIGIVDADRVSLSNLQRQVLFGGEDVGRRKVEAARDRLAALNPHVAYELYPVALSRDNALDIIQDYDAVADGTDNFPTRYLVNDACVLLGKPLIYGSVFRFEGQVSVFNWAEAAGQRGPNYRNLYPTPPAAGTVPSCAEGGVLGVLPGIIGSLQANEAIKVLSQTGRPLSGKVLLFDAASGQSRLIGLPPQAPFPVTRLEDDYAFFCGYGAGQVPEVSPQELQRWRERNVPFQLLDVREEWEYREFNIGGTLIPLNRLEQQAAGLPPETITVVVCQSGIRSARAVEILRDVFGFQEAYNLQGGLEAWKQAGLPQQ